MRNHKFGKRSATELATAHQDLILIMAEALVVSPIDFGISEGHRSLEKQKSLYQLGKSKNDGVLKKSKHNYSPSLAVDIYAFVNGHASYNKNYILIIAGVILATAERLIQEGKIKNGIRWGGNWDMDNEPITDQSFNDLVHFELLHL